MEKNVFIGYDTREDIAYQVCEYSINKKSSNTITHPLKQEELRKKNFYWRGEDKLASTEFTFTRFLVPALMQYKGWSLFCDSDIIFLDDIKNLFDHADEKYAVLCVKHEYNPPAGFKMDGRVQTQYPRKNWSSLILWNNSHPSNRKINVDLINDPETTGKYLHRFSWLDDNEIGSLPLEWNWLVGWYSEPQNGTPKAIHYTEGGPWFKDYRECEYHNEWKQLLFNMMNEKSKNV